MGVSKIIGKHPKMDGLFHGKPLLKWMINRGTPLFLETSICFQPGFSGGQASCIFVGSQKVAQVFFQPGGTTCFPHMLKRELMVNSRTPWKTSTPWKTKMEPKVMEVWFRSFSFLFMGDL